MKTNSKKHIFLVAGFMAISLTSCKVGPDYKLPEISLPESWVNNDAVKTTEAEIKQEWWKNFNDPLLNSLIEEAGAQNLGLREATARVREARALSNGADADLFPQINIGGNVTRTGKNNNAGGGGNNTKLFEVGFDAIWEADIFGGNRRVAESAEADYEAAQAELADVNLTLAAEVARNYIEYRLYQQQLKLAKQTAEVQGSTARITKARYEEGVEGRLELSRIEAQVATTQAQVPLYESLAGASQYRLEYLLGKQPGNLKERLAEEKQVPFADPVIATETPLDVMKRRPDVKAAERRLASTTAMQGAAIAQMYPKLSISAVLGLRSTDADNLFRSSSKAWSAGGSLLAPLFDFGRVRSGINAADARQEQAMAQYESSVLASLQDVETALLAYAKESERNEALKEAAAKSSKAVEISQLQYKEGIISQLDVLQAQDAMYVANNALAQSSANVAANLVALYKALAL